MLTLGFMCINRGYSVLSKTEKGLGSQERLSCKEGERWGRGGKLRLQSNAFSERRAHARLPGYGVRRAAHAAHATGCVCRAVPRGVGARLIMLAHTDASARAWAWEGARRGASSGCLQPAPARPAQAGGAPAAGGRRRQFHHVRVVSGNMCNLYKLCKLCWVIRASCASCWRQPLVKLQSNSGQVGALLRERLPAGAFHGPWGRRCKCRGLRLWVSISKVRGGGGGAGQAVCQQPAPFWRGLWPLLFRRAPLHNGPPTIVSPVAGE